MPQNFSPIRWNKIHDARNYIYNNDYGDATDEAKLFFLFKKINNLIDGLSFKEIALVLHPEMIFVDEKTGQIFPNQDSCEKTRKAFKILRKTTKNHSVVLYCNRNTTTGAVLYYNIPTKELYDETRKFVNRCARGILENRRNVLSSFELGRKARKSLTKHHADDLRRIQMKKEVKKMYKKRREEVEEISKQNEQQENKEQAET